MEERTLTRAAVPGPSHRVARSRVTWGLVCVAVCVLATPIHEVGHWLGFRLSGIPAAISFNHTYFTDRWAPSFPGAFGGPLMSIVAAWLGVLLARRGPAPLGAALALFMPMTRLVGYALFALIPKFPIAYNDEGVMALLSGTGPWTWVLALTPLLVAPLVLLWRSLARRRWSTGERAAFFLAGALLFFFVARFEAESVDPLVFPDAQARELVMPHAPRAR
jgi:hypothetical protein